MANFKGGFAFNNEAAKVEVEQAPDGTLISCVNPVTGEELGGGATDVITGTVAAPFPDMTQDEYDQLISDMADGHAAAVMIIDATATGLGDLPTGLLGIVDENGGDGANYTLIAQVADPTPDNQIKIAWAHPNAVASANARVRGSLVDMSETASNFPTTTTIYRF